MGKGQTKGAYAPMATISENAVRWDHLKDLVRHHLVCSIFEAGSGKLLFDIGPVAWFPNLDQSLPRYLYLECSEEGLGSVYLSDNLQQMHCYMDSGRFTFREYEAQIAGLRQSVIDEMDIYCEDQPLMIYDLDQGKTVIENG